MPALLKTRPIEGSTATVTCVFKDVDNSLISVSAINSIYWNLKDENGNIVNNRTSVEVTSKTNPLLIVLTGDDLPSGKLTFTIDVVYGSNLQNNLSLKDSITFYVDNLTYND